MRRESTIGQILKPTGNAKAAPRHSAAKKAISQASKPVSRLKPTGETGRKGQKQFNVWLPETLIESLRDAAHHERQTTHDIAVRAIEGELARMVKKNGKPFPKRAGPIKTGRPLK